MAQDLNKSLTDDHKMMSEFEKSLKIGHEDQDKKDKTPLEDKMNLLKLQPKKNDLSNPVRLCPSLYYDILVSYIQILTTEECENSYMQIHRDIGEIVKFGMIGEEALASIISLFQEAKELEIDQQVTFDFGDWDYCYSSGLDGYNNFVKKLVKVAIPFVKRVSFGGNNEKWQDFCFEVLSKDSRQKELEIHGLEKVDDLVKMALKNLFEKGVLIKFLFDENQIWKDLPPYQYESLIFWDFHTEFMTRMKEVKCGFNVLEFSDLSAEYISMKLDMEPFFPNIKRIFPKSEKLVVKLTYFIDKYGCDVYPDIAGCLLDTVKFVNDAPQNQIDLSLYAADLCSRVVVPEVFIKKNKSEYFWKCKSNENKVIKLNVSYLS